MKPALAGLVLPLLLAAGPLAAQERPSSVADSNDRDRAAYADCAQASTSGPCEQYLAAFPSGAFADSARGRIAAMQARAAQRAEAERAEPARQVSPEWRIEEMAVANKPGSKPESSHHYSAKLSSPPPPPPPPQPPPPPPAPVAGDRGPTAVISLPASDEPVATRLFARSIGDIPGDFGAIAVILFPNDAALNPARLAQVCTAFVAVLGDATATAAVAPHRAQMVTVWPVTANFPAARSDVAAGHGAAAIAALCPDATARYDYITAERVRRLVPPAARPAAEGRGPFLVAWAPGGRLGDPRSPMLTYDLSQVEGQTRLTKAMKLWKEQIEERPQLWRDGWDATLFRLEVSSTVDAIGAQIGAAMKLVPWLGGGN